VPSGVSVTKPASFSTRRCCETAERVTGRPAEICPTEAGAAARRWKIARRLGSPRALRARTASALVMTNVNTSRDAISASRATERPGGTWGETGLA